jgi:hypothetical protein
MGWQFGCSQHDWGALGVAAVLACERCTLVKNGFVWPKNEAPGGGLWVAAEQGIVVDLP